MESRDLNWRKATYSSSNGGACIEVANACGGVLVRDTKQAARVGRTTLSVTPGAWRAFTARLK